MGSEVSKKNTTSQRIDVGRCDRTSRIREEAWSHLSGGEKSYDPLDPTLTFVDEDDTLDFELEDYKSRRALMSCGHAVTPISLTKWCQMLLNQKGESTFTCGVYDCDDVWSFEEVCKMALLTPEEMGDFERKMFNNSKDRLDFKQCPGCSSFVVKADPHYQCVECTLCSTEKNRVYKFCWQCLHEWKGSSSHKDFCGNDGCVNISVEILRNCPDTTFKQVDGIHGCPSVRACPHCGFLVEHDTTFCKYIFCSRCKKNFCFVCLKYKRDCVKLSGSYDTCKSGVAPRQTSIPVWQILLDDPKNADQRRQRRHNLKSSYY